MLLLLICVTGREEMEEKKIVYNIILQIWNVYKDLFSDKDRKLTDDEWDNFVETVENQAKQYIPEGEEYNKLYRDMAIALTNFMSRREKQYEN